MDKLGSSPKLRISQKHLFYALNSSLPLIVGLVLYIVFCRDARISTFFLRCLKTPELTGDILPHYIGTFIRNHACDMLWAYSLTFSISWVLGYSRKRLSKNGFLCILFAGIMEFRQIFHWSSGTFDVLDILLEALTICAATILIYRHEEVCNEKSSTVI